MQTRKILIRILMFFLKLLLAAVIAIGIYRIGEFAYDFGHSIYDERGVTDPPGKDVAIVLPEGSTLRQVAELLEAKRLIRDKWVFLVQERLSRYHGQIRAGSYVLNNSQSADEILAILTGHAEDLAKESEDE